MLNVVVYLLEMDELSHLISVVEFNSFCRIRICHPLELINIQVSREMIKGEMGIEDEVIIRYGESGGIV